jgi:hypothetical protein
MANWIYKGEREAALKALAAIKHLALTSTYSVSDIAAVRLAARAATDAIRYYSSERMLDDARSEVATACSELCGLMECGGVTQRSIDGAKRTIREWLKEVDLTSR